MNESEKDFSADQIRERVRSRYPDAEPIPDHPQLQELLDRIGFDVRWNPATSTYYRPNRGILFTSGSSVPPRHSTATSPRPLEVTPDVADARAFEERLHHAYNDGGFLVLTVRPSRMRSFESNLLMWSRRNGYSITVVSFDDLLFETLRDEAKKLEVDWSVIEQADGAAPTSQDWKNLMQLVGRVGPTLASALAERSEHLLLVNPGLIARYDLMPILETLRDRVGHDAPCPGLWVLVASDGQNDMPVLDHAEIPLITPGQRVRVSEAWVDNLHRGRMKDEGGRMKEEEQVQ